MDTNMDGKVAIVTGGSKGIGKAIAASLAGAGAKVMITSRKAEVCEATVVELSEQTGGDLAEILNKISGLVRERFKILGQVKALTGEGRISGIVLMALPPALFLAVYYLNPDYVMVLFEHEDGRKMMTGAIILQIIGAFVIRKICDIKV